jgi:hypothetical protein
VACVYVCTADMYALTCTISPTESKIMEQIESIRGRAKTTRRLQAVALSNMINRIEASTMSDARAGAIENSSKGSRFIRRLTEALGNKSVEDEIYTGDDTTRIYVYIASDNEIVKEVCLSVLSCVQWFFSSSLSVSVLPFLCY